MGGGTGLATDMISRSIFTYARRGSHAATRTHTRRQKIGR
jgi:hypothetical protein